MNAENERLREDPNYWTTYFSVRIASTLREIRDKQARTAMREDLEAFLRTSVPPPRTKELVRTEMRRR